VTRARSSARRNRALLALAVAALATDCRERTVPPNVLVISVDTLRADHLACYGYARPTSPRMDALAAEGVLFEQAYSPTSWTLPGHASMLSGLSPYRHGALESTRRIRDDVPLLAERLRQRGYRTAAIVNAPFVQARYGFARGFERFVEAFDVRDAEGYQPRVEELLGQLPGPPFFVFVHYMAVHSPYTPPPRFNRFVSAGGPAPGVDGRRLVELNRRLAEGSVTLAPRDVDHLRSLYDGEILAVDEALGRTVDIVRRLGGTNTLVVLTSDHGEEFLEHGALTHGSTLYDEVLRVPLIVAGPGVSEGHRVSAMVSLMDIVPTLLERAGGPADATLDGRSLAGFLRGAGQASAADVIALQTSAHDGSVRLRGLRSRSHKLVADDATGRQDVYDLGADPGERRPAGGSPEAARLARLLSGLRPLAASPVSEPAPAEREALRALGYQ
jgi:arylsulfatase A-like enzyme